MKIVLQLLTAKGDDALTVKFCGNHYSYIGKYDAGSTHEIDRMRAILVNLVRDHRRMRVALTDGTFDSVISTLSS